MPAHPVTIAEAQAAVDALTAANGNMSAAARTLNIPRTTLANRVDAAKLHKIRPGDDALETAQKRIRSLEATVADLQKQALTETMIRQSIIGLAQAVDQTKTPAWLIKPDTGAASPGVPTLFASDFHWGEIVFPSQINGVNKFNVEIAKARLKTLAERTMRLLSIISPKIDYPGIVLLLGGDMISGNIHDELVATNELNSVPAVLDLFGELRALILSLADMFGCVRVVAVSGNHGRDTTKIWHKDRHKTSFDWMLYCFLAKSFERDKRVTFLIPDGPDAYFRIYSHRYLLTHGDQFRGGDGMIGALGPIIRGDHKKRSRNAQIEMEYDTLLLGHWHQYIHLTRLIVNGSLKGYDEYAYSNNFPFEPPQQALWVTHPKYGITYRAPIFLGQPRAVQKTEWISVPASQAA